jgi:hypothetical protein
MLIMRIIAYVRFSKLIHRRIRQIYTKSYFKNFSELSSKWMISEYLFWSKILDFIIFKNVRITTKVHDF